MRVCPRGTRRSPGRPETTEVLARGARGTHERGAAIRFVFAGGGTGGHTAPAVAVADELGRMIPSATIDFLGTGRPGEARLLEAAGYRGRVTGIRRGSARLRRSSLSAAVSACACLADFARRRPSAVIGVGGYAAAGAVVAGAVTRAPIVLLEQNAIAGRTTRRLARFATEVICPWEATLSTLPPRARGSVIGNPVRSGLFDRQRPAARDELGLRGATRVILVVGGSQGSEALNALSPTIGAAACEAGAAVLHLAGSGADAVRAAYDRLGVAAVVHGFLGEMASAYAAADLAISRAGATAIAELGATGTPAVLVPFPQAVDDHQRANAREASATGGAVTVEQEEFTEWAAGGALVEMLRDREHLARMRAAARAAERPDVTASVARRIVEIAKGVR